MVCCNQNTCCFPPRPQTYCCDLYARDIADKLFPPYQPPVIRGCCMVSTNQRRPVSFAQYKARKEFGLW